MENSENSYEKVNGLPNATALYTPRASTSGSPPAIYQAARHRCWTTATMPNTTTAKPIVNSTVTATPARKPAAANRHVGAGGSTAAAPARCLTAVPVGRPSAGASSMYAPSPNSADSTWPNSWVANGSNMVDKAMARAAGVAVLTDTRIAKRRISTANSAAGNAALQKCAHHRPTSAAGSASVAGGPPAAR